jgi:hypothetical protein
MKTYTMEDILTEEPCENNYPLERLTELAAGREQVTSQEIADLDIPINDRLWILSRLLYRTSPHTANRVSRLIALDVANKWDCPDTCYWYLMTGNTDSRKAAAWAARAARATWAARATSTAAWLAAEAAAAWVAEEAAEEAAAAAARAAAWAAWAAEEEEKALEKYLAWIVRAWEVHP